MRHFLTYGAVRRAEGRSFRAIEHQQRNADMQRKQARNEKEKIEDQLDALRLASAAMWELMKEKLAVTDAELEAKMDAIDSADGHKDGRYRPRPTTCSCGAKVNASDSICIYCSKPVERQNLF